MNDAELYDYAERMLAFWNQDREGEITEAEFVEVFGTEAPSEADQDKIRALIKDMIQHNNEIEDNDTEEEAVAEGSSTVEEASPEDGEGQPA